MVFQISSAKRTELINKGEFLVTEINFEVINAIISWILNNRPAKKSFTLLINSSGGSPSAVIYFAAFLATLNAGVKFKGVVFGECGSAALALLQCCNERIAVKHSGFFIHHLNFRMDISCHGYDLQKIEMELKQSQETEEELIRLQCKRSGMSRDEWMKLADQGEQIGGRALFPEKALALNLIDKIVERYAAF